MPWEDIIMPAVISATIKSYIAGFLDGDGCIMFQLVRRKDYIYGYQIRASIVFYQKRTYYPHLEWLKSIFRNGYLRIRKDNMAEYTIVGIKDVCKVIKLLRPYVRLKKEHIKLALNIEKELNKKLTLKNFLRICRLVDKYKELNYSKKRTNTSKQVEQYLKEHNLYPRND